MSKFDLLKETLLGNLGEEIPISLWKHHPDVDRNPEGLAQAEIAFHRLVNHDLLKISFFGHFPCIDFGCTAEYDGALTGSTTLTSAAINDVSDWETLEPLDVNAGELHHHFLEGVGAFEHLERYVQQAPNEVQVGCAVTVSQKAIMSDSDKARWQRVQQKPAYKLNGADGGRF